MTQTQRNEQREERHFRFSMAMNLAFARLTLLLVKLLRGLAKPLPQQIQHRFEGVARLLVNLAGLSIQPEYVRKMVRLRYTRYVIRSSLDGAILGGIVGAWLSFYLFDSLTLLNVLVGVALFALLLIIMLLVSFLSVSGDLYVERQDEFQRIVSNEASAFTLRVVTLLLVLFFLLYLFFRDLRGAVLFHISIIFFVSRLVYLIKLTQLRWQDMAEMEMEGMLDFETVQIDEKKGEHG